jgi:hypothetical protein
VTVRRLLAAVLAVGVGAGLLGLASGRTFANHVFPDVPTGNPFHEDIEAFFAAGCASGFPDGTYHPDDPVKRQQMARFVNACGGRVDFSDPLAGFTLSETAIPVVSLDMTTDASQGAGFVMVQAAVRIESASTAGFPCDVEFNSATIAGEELHLELPINTSNPIEDASGFITYTFVLPAGSNSTPTITARIANGCTATVQAFTRGAATYYPFNGAGEGGGSV